MILSPLLELPSSCSRETVVGNASSLKEEFCVAHAPYSVLCVPRADRTNVHCHRHDASCSPNRVCSKRAHRVSASHPLRMRKALARLMSCLFLASPRAPWIRTLRLFNTLCPLSASGCPTGIKMDSRYDLSRTVDEGHALPHVILRLDLRHATAVCRH